MSLNNVVSAPCKWSRTQQIFWVKAIARLTQTIFLCHPSLQQCYICAPWLLAFSLLALMRPQPQTYFLLEIQTETNFTIDSDSMYIKCGGSVMCIQRDWLWWMEDNVQMRVLLWATHSTRLWICFYAQDKSILNVTRCSFTNNNATYGGAINAWVSTTDQLPRKFIKWTRAHSWCAFTW